MKEGLSYWRMSQTMSVPAEKGKAGAHRKGGLVLTWAQRQKQCVSGQEGAVCGGNSVLDTVKLVFSRAEV